MKKERKGVRREEKKETGKTARCYLLPPCKDVFSVSFLVEYCENDRQEKVSNYIDEIFSASSFFTYECVCSLHWFNRYIRPICLFESIFTLPISLVDERESESELVRERSQRIEVVMKGAGSSLTSENETLSVPYV